MTTRADLRTSLRQWLEDTTATPLWDDATLNEALAGAIRAYGTRVPKEATTALVVAAGETRVSVPAPVIDPARIVRLLDPLGAVVPRAAAGEAVGAEAVGGAVAQAWRWWEATLILARPAVAGTWQLEYLATRAVPTDDVTPVDLLPGDEEIVLALALATALQRRATEDAKRGALGRGVSDLAATARDQAARLLDARRRRARGGRLA